MALITVLYCSSWNDEEKDLSLPSLGVLALVGGQSIY
jgi:hypothetical protein